MCIIKVFPKEFLHLWSFFSFDHTFHDGLDVNGLTSRVVPKDLVWVSENAPWPQQPSLSPQDLDPGAASPNLSGKKTHH